MKRPTTTTKKPCRRASGHEPEKLGGADSTPIYTNNSGSSLDEDPVHIYLATEDPTAVRAMRANMPLHWKLYVDPYVREFSKYRQRGYNGNVRMIKAQRGTPALSGLASLLIAMEANDFVLTMASNWSRLMNDLRRFIVQQHFSTSVIDLRPNHRPYPQKNRRHPRKKN